jgi:hypothetical protein
MNTWARTVFRILIDGHVFVAGGGVAVAAGALKARGLIRCTEPHLVSQMLPAGECSQSCLCSKTLAT